MERASEAPKERRAWGGVGRAGRGAGRPAEEPESTGEATESREGEGRGKRDDGAALRGGGK